MGEVNASPEVTTRVVEDVSSMEVDPDKGERLYKAAFLHSNQGTTYRMLAKSFPGGKVDIVHYACDLDVDGNPATKWRITRILAVAPERFDAEIEFIKKNLKGNGEEVQGIWVHDMTGMPDLIAQGNSLGDWNRKMAAEIRKQPS